ncbi:ABC transporter ATP-binding protein [Desulfoscipio gibsoniae]|uniref:ABC-type multidrug transport system, ATPase and permease component n=1 Tax=Desulfoscipio gibsoniae DSM 7213 TaxID=767817 RepID=R4KJF0_9FIRM|nr:ABC transporter ATP-binding protein [Desulfoscipio gibsoniae]AGL02749.1 ABC-type multidrug transport system, ATPase and permease component [Desulfoscipio gibsoniae DSM 7213]
MNGGRVGRRFNGKHGGGPGTGPPMVRPVEKAKDFKGTLIRLLGYLKPRRYQLLAVFGTAVLGTLFNIVSPKLIGAAITRLFDDVMSLIQGVPGAGIDFKYILHILLVLGGLYIFSALFSYLQNYIMSSVAQLTVYDLRKEVNHKLARLPLRFYDAHTHGEILSRVVNDIDNISSTLQQSIIQLVTSLVTLVGVIVMMLTISPLMTFLLVLILPLSFIVTRAIASRSQKFFVGQQKALGELNGHVEEMYTGHLVVKAFGYEDKSIARFEEINAKLYHSGWRALFISGIIMPLMNFINNIGYVMVCVVGGVLVTRQAIKIGDVQAFIQYARQFSHPITQAANMANIIQSTIASAERVFELLDEPEQVPEPHDAGVIISPKGEVKFSGVSFSYQQDVPLIENLDIDVRSGQTVAIVGPTGAGKTTLVNLLMRFYELDDGQITIDGINIARLKRGNLRSLFGMVLQDTWLFNGTIRDNIAYGREGVTEAEVIQAARAAGADHFIRTLPDGYDTLLNEEASNISQGQKQLLSIARAILADPAILILDEATSSVDTRTEIKIQKAMNELRRGRTSFVIAHRLSTIRDADLILVMDKGRVVEKGRHEELLARDGFYADLYYSQFAEEA